MGRVRPITLELDDKLWTRFKELTPRTITLNDAIVRLIEREVLKLKK